MPLYMDIHFVNEVSVDDTRKAHLADLAVQEKYGVKYLQYWFNEKAGTIFCLMEGPDKESCEATHREANGISACQIVEVEGGLYDIFMGENQKLDHGLVRHEDGMIDTGNRYILTLDILANTQISDSVEYDQLKLPKQSKKRALAIIDECNGKEVRTAGFDCIIAVFKSPEKILRCAHEIKKELLKSNTDTAESRDDVTFNMGISVGQPLTEKEGFFEKAIQASRRLCMIGSDKEIITSRLFEEICDANDVMKKHISLRIVKPSEQAFLDDLLDITENRLVDFEFGVDVLSKEIGFSKPQLYRRVTAITGRSPVNFIRDLRMNKALSLIKENKYNISQIALEVGYNNPSYFSKCFQEKFGIKPSKIAI